MNAVDRWKVVLTLIAIFVAGGVTGGFLMIRAMKYEMPRRSKLPPGAPFAVASISRKFNAYSCRDYER